MYRQHFNLEKKPFQISSDNEFLWLGEKHTAALELLKKGITRKRGLLVLTGDIGTGKTTLVNEIIHTQNTDTLFSIIVDPGFEMYHLLEFIAQDFGFENQYKEGKKFSSEFFSFVKSAGENGKKVLVVVDEAQRMTARFLNEVLLWSESGLNGTLTVILAGQIEFHDVLRKSLGQNWKDRVPIHAYLEPLNEEETKIYINNRLETAGSSRKIFLVPAIQEAHGWSKGFPRLINIACDQALIAAYAKGMRLVDASTFKQGIRELDLPIGQPEKQELNKGKLSEEENYITSQKGFIGTKWGWFASAACICLFIGNLFYNGYAPSATEKEIPSRPEHTLNESLLPISEKVLEPVGQKTGLGYTTTSFSENMEYLHPVMATAVVKNSAPQEIKKSMPGNLDQFVEDVFLLKKKIRPLPESPVKAENQPEINPTQEKSLAEPGRGLTEKDIEDYPVSSITPEPDAIIDWLFEKRKIVKK